MEKQYLRMGVLFLLLSLSSCAKTDSGSGSPPQNIPAWTRQVVVVRPAHSFHGSLTAWERDATGWKRIAGPWPVVLGRKGFALPGEKREGDGRTPSGIFSLGLAFGRPASLPTNLAYRQVTDDDYWIDDSSSPLYNQWVRGKPAATSCEKMLLDNGLYDAGIVVEYNTKPVVPGRGSAIFVHLWAENGKKPTSGCIALERDNLALLLRWLDAKAKPVIVLGMP